MKKRKGSATVSPIKKFYRWKYSGLVVVPTAVLIILTGWFSYTSTLEFYDHFSCQGLIDYVTLDRDLGEGIPRHNELTERQHAHLHEILQPCIEGQFLDIEP
jgi:hypothetical protein